MNSRHRRVRNIAWRICAAAALLCAAAGVPAQTVHKQVDATGRITYSDRPDMTPSPPAATAPALDVATALASNSAMSSRGAAVIDAKEAARTLGQAQQERKQGAQRPPGEQPHAADAGVANQRHLKRQEKLRHLHEQAQRRSSEIVRSLRPHS